MKTALVTGFATNIGKSITKKFLENKYSVIGVHCPYTIAQANALVMHEDRLQSVQADFTDSDSVTELIWKLKSFEFDVIINNAGMVNLQENGHILNEFIEFDYSKFSDVMHCNFDAPLRLCLELKNNLKRGGSIVNIASGGGMRASYATISYAASKAALINLTASLSNSFYPFNEIRVNSVSPGWVNPDEGGSMGVSSDSPGRRAGRIISMGRNASTNEIANVVYFLTTSDASFINGANIVVDGGWLNHNVIYYEEAMGKKILALN